MPAPGSSLASVPPPATSVIPTGLAAVLAGAVASAAAEIEADLSALTGRRVRVAAAGAPGPGSDWRGFSPADRGTWWWEVTMGFHGGAAGRGELAWSTTVARQLAGCVFGDGQADDGMLDALEQQGLVELGSVVLGGLLEGFLARMGAAPAYGLPRLELRGPAPPEAGPPVLDGTEALAVPLRFTVESQALEVWLRVRASEEQWTAWSGKTWERKMAAAA